MQKLKAILFDLDGTLIDSEYFHYQCWLEILDTFSLSMTYQEWVSTYAGYPLPINSKTIKEKYNLDIDLSELIDWRERLSKTGFFTKDINLMPYALETIQFFKQKGLKLAVVTASPRTDVELIFARNGLSSYFDLMITRTDVTLTKPDPECYNTCCQKLGLEKDECLAFEDTINGLKAAKAANLVCYAIQSDASQHPKLAIADKIFKDLKIATEDIERHFAF
ncbi:HAD family phosphatase [Pedobacter sp. B4-66]|uniref:HAD family hydrolase n=1 Tax=Pedobacter sp. B4-66 TaxID=2817280 RepID=UPI001BDA6EEB|nr:HAD family phosphatase [Pedobacter sp. B4-66]